jgi:hypothetical protein
LKYALTVILAFSIVCCLVAFGLSNPSPDPGWYPRWVPPWELDIGPITSIIISELCGLLLGTVVLVHHTQLRSKDATVAVFIALTVSYVIGLVIWTVGFLEGILIANPVSNPVNPFPLFNPTQHLLGLTVLLLPEFLGTLLGAIIIRVRLRVGWRRALASMAIAMLTAFLVNIVIISLSLA